MKQSSSSRRAREKLSSRNSPLNRRRLPVTTNSFRLRAALAAVLFTQMTSLNSLAASPHIAPGSQWSIEVEKVEPGSTNVDPAFSAAIYENLVEELSKSKQFNQVFRTGDPNATGAQHLAVLATKVQSYTAGSETKRAVTTVGGATKLGVLIQLRTNDGKL